MKKVVRIFCLLGFFSFLMANSGCTLLWMASNDSRVTYYTVTFETDGGSAVPSQKVAEKKPCVCPPAPTKQGFTFAGWYYDSTCLSPFDFSSLIYASITLYAKWTPNVFKLTFMNEEEKIGSIEVGFGEDLPDLDAKYILEDAEDGTHFMGYYTEKKAKGTQYYNAEGMGMYKPTSTADVTLYASFGYSITYHLDGGTNNAGNPSHYTGDNDVELKAPNKIGSTFAGWYEDSGFSGDAVTSIPKETKADVELWAKWDVNSYFIKFDKNANDATGIMANQEFEYGTPENLTTVGYERAGYDFDGWNTKADGSGRTYPNTAEILNLTAVKDEIITFYAQWKAEAPVPPTTYSITVTGGTANKATAEEGDTVTITANSPAPTGKEFDEWTSSPAVSFMDANSSTTDFTMPAQNVTVTATWKNATYTVTLNANGGTINSGNVTSYVYGSGATLPNGTQITKDGFEFAGWYEESDFSGSQVTSISTSATGNKVFYAKWTENAPTTANYTVKHLFQKVSGGTSESDYESNPSYEDETENGNIGDPTVATSKTVAGFTAQPISQGTIANDGTTVVKVYYNRVSVTYTFDPNGGKWSDDSTTSKTDTGLYGATVTKPADPTKDGFTFDGYDEDVPATFGTANATFTAQWENATYTVTLNANGGAINSGNVTSYVYGSGATLPNGTQITKDGFEFAGWYEESDFSGSQVTSISTSATGNKVFYAKWTPTYTITVIDGTASKATAGENEIITVTADTPATGMAFAKWESDDVSFTVETDSSTTFLMPAQDVTVTATWKNATYSITLETNGGVIASGDVTEYTYGTGATLPNDAQITKDGYVFGGWYEEDDFSGLQVTDISTTETGDKTFYAKWTPISYTVAFDANGGEGSIPSMLFTYDTPQNLTENAELITNGVYTFRGWNTDSEAVDALYGDGEQVTNLTTIDGASITLYAIWAENP